MKTNLLVDKNKGARIDASVYPWPQCFRSPARSWIPGSELAWTLGLQRGNSEEGSGFGGVPWWMNVPPGAAAGEARPGVSSVAHTHTLCFAFLGAESGLSLAQRWGAQARAHAASWGCRTSLLGAPAPPVAVGLTVPATCKGGSCVSPGLGSIQLVSRMFKL